MSEPDETTDEARGRDLPVDVIDAAERLTRLARRASVDGEAEAYRRDRDARLDEYGFEARVREEERRDVLVCYPTEWMREDTVQLDRIEDRSRAVEVPLGGVGTEDEWEDVEAHNQELVARIEEAAGPVHATNVRAFADFMGNHYVRRMESAGPREIREFLEEYYPRNAWPSDGQRDVVEDSIRLVFEMAGRATPPPVCED